MENEETTIKTIVQATEMPSFELETEAPSIEENMNSWKDNMQNFGGALSHSLEVIKNYGNVDSTKVLGGLSGLLDFETEETENTDVITSTESHTLSLTMPSFETTSITSTTSTTSTSSTTTSTTTTTISTTTTTTTTTTSSTTSTTTTRTTSTSDRKGSFELDSEAYQ